MRLVEKNGKWEAKPDLATHIICDDYDMWWKTSGGGTTFSNWSNRSFWVKRAQEENRYMYYLIGVGTYEPVRSEMSTTFERAYTVCMRWLLQGLL